MWVWVIISLFICHTSKENLLIRFEKFGKYLSANAMQLLVGEE